MKKIASLKRRIIIALIFILVLGGVAPTLVFYSLGYRFDWNKKIFVHSGSIVLKSFPGTINAALDGKAVASKSIDFINQTTNINGLTPKKYLLEISAPGFQSWKKETEVHSGIATEYWNVLLPPVNIQKNNIMGGDILLYSFSPDKNNLAYFVKQDEWISLFVRDKNDKDIFVYKESVNQRFVPQEGELKWSGDGKWLLFSLKQEGREKVFLASNDLGYQTIVPIGDIWQDTLNKEMETQAQMQNNLNANNQNKNSQLNKNDNKNQKKQADILPLEKEEAIEVTYSWDKKDNIYFLLEGSLYVQSASLVSDWWTKNEQNYSNNNENKTLANENVNKNISKNSNINSEKEKTIFSTEKIIASDERAYPQKIGENFGGFTFCDNFICAVNLRDGNIDFISESGVLDHQISFPSDYKTLKKYKIFAYGSDRLAVLDNEDNLFVWDKKGPLNTPENSNLLKFLTKGAREVYFSDDGKKLLFATKQEALVYFLREWEVQPKHLAGEMELIFRQDPELERIQWYLDYQHIFIVNKDAVKIVELDPRGGRNVFDFFLGQNITGFDYSTGDRKAWFMEGEGSSSKLQEVSFPETNSFIQSFIGGGQQQGNNQVK